MCKYIKITTNTIKQSTTKTVGVIKVCSALSPIEHGATIQEKWDVGMSTVKIALYMMIPACNTVLNGSLVTWSVQRLPIKVPLRLKIDWYEEAKHQKLTPPNHYYPPPLKQCFFKNYSLTYHILRFGDKYARLRNGSTLVKVLALRLLCADLFSKSIFIHCQ